MKKSKIKVNTVNSQLSAIQASRSLLQLAKAGTFPFSKVTSDTKV
jgi:hypothetical protein